MRYLEAYAAGGDAYECGEPAQPPATIPLHRKDAWLKGWAEQKAFMERQAAGRKQKPSAAADRRCRRRAAASGRSASARSPGAASRR
jgi:hypothetical protein